MYHVIVRRSDHHAASGFVLMLSNRRRALFTGLGRVSLETMYLNDFTAHRIYTLRPTTGRGIVSKARLDDCFRMHIRPCGVLSGIVEEDI